MASPPSSHTELCVSGLEVHVYGLKETLNSKTSLADVIFTLPGRQGTYQSIERFAQEILAKDKAQLPRGRQVVDLSSYLLTSGTMGTGMSRTGLMILEMREMRCMPELCCPGALDTWVRVHTSIADLEGI